MNTRRLLLAATLMGSAVLSGCAVYTVGPPPVAYGDPAVVYPAAPVVVGPPVVYPSVRIDGYWSSGPRWHRGWR